MTTFLYRAIDSNKNYCFGSGSYNKKSDFEKYLQKLNFYDIEIFNSKTPFKENTHPLISDKEMSIICKQISLIFSSYIPLTSGLALLNAQCENKIMKIVFEEINYFLEKGFTLSEAFSMYKHIFDKYFLQMIFIAEKSSNFSSVFNYLSSHYEKEQNIKQKLKGAILYPIILFSITCLIFIYLQKSATPIFESISKSLNIYTSPFNTSFILVTSFLSDYFLPFIIVILIAFIIFYFWLKNRKNKYTFDKFKATFPIISYITIRIYVARFSRAVSLFLKNGTSIHDAVKHSTILIDNTYITKKIDSINNENKDVDSLLKELKKIHILPNLFVQMVIIGYETGNLETTLSEICKIYEDEAYDTIYKATRLIEPILITLLTLFVIFILISIVVPMITIMNSI